VIYRRLQDGFQGAISGNGIWELIKNQYESPLPCLFCDKLKSAAPTAKISGGFGYVKEFVYFSRKQAQIERVVGLLRGKENCWFARDELGYQRCFADSSPPVYYDHLKRFFVKQPVERRQFLFSPDKHLVNLRKPLCKHDYYTHLYSIIRSRSGVVNKLTKNFIKSHYFAKNH
jgi:hypothetical protein